MIFLYETEMNIFCKTLNCVDLFCQNCTADVDTFHCVPNIFVFPKSFQLFVPFFKNKYSFSWNKIFIAKEVALTFEQKNVRYKNKMKCFLTLSNHV